MAPVDPCRRIIKILRPLLSVRPLVLFDAINMSTSARFSCVYSLWNVAGSVNWSGNHSCKTIFTVNMVGSRVGLCFLGSSLLLFLLVKFKFIPVSNSNFCWRSRATNYVSQRCTTESLTVSQAHGLCGSRRFWSGTDGMALKWATLTKSLTAHLSVKQEFKEFEITQNAQVMQRLQLEIIRHPFMGKNRISLKLFLHAIDLKHACSLETSALAGS